MSLPSSAGPATAATAERGGRVVRVAEHELQGAYALQATWAACALWRLSFTPENAKTVLLHAPQALLRVLE